MRKTIPITVGAMLLAAGLTGPAQAESFNIFSVSKGQEAAEAKIEEVGRRRGHRHRHWHGRRHWNPGAAFALGTIGTIAGLAAYNSRYYCDPYYEYCGPRRVYRRHYYGGPYYYAPRRYYYYD